MGWEGCHRCHPCRGAVYFESLTGGVASLNHRLQAGKPLLPEWEGWPFRIGSGVWHGMYYIQLDRIDYKSGIVPSYSSQRVDFLPFTGTTNYPINEADEHCQGVLLEVLELLSRQSLTALASASVLKGLGK